MVKLSVVIITFNEEKNIGRCIASVKDLADEILVVDSFSTDRTEAICREHGVRFVQHPFHGHIEQKNYALDLAAHDHVLSLDADEALSPELAKSVRAVQSDWTKDVYVIKRLTNYCGTWIRHGGWYPDPKIRLFRKDKGRWGGQNPHDRLEPVTEATVGRLGGDLLHYSYYSIDDHARQAAKFSAIGAQSAFEAGRKASVFAVFLKPLYKFIRDYFLLLGFLDGYHGFIIARISANATFLKYARLRQLCKQRSAA